MASEKFTKSVEFKATDDTKGNVEAVFSVYNKLDTDGDVVVPGAIKSGFKDNQVPMVFAHKWDQPIGKGTIISDDDKAVFKGNFFMNTEAGREAYNLAKEMGDLQEWSFGFRIHDYEIAEYKSDDMEEPVDVRYLKNLEVYEVSPVLVGANRETYTLAIKSGEEAVYQNSNIEEKEEVAPEVFSTVEEAEARAKEIGCEGSHEYEVNGQIVYMPCKTHEDFEAAMGEDEDEEDEKSSGEESSECCQGDCCQSKEKHCSYGDDGNCAKENEKDLKISDDDSSLQGKRFSDEVKDVLAALESLIVRAKAISILREKDGRELSSKAESALRAVQEDLDDAWNELDSIIGSEKEEEEVDVDAEVAEAEVSTEEVAEAVSEDVEVEEIDESDSESEPEDEVSEEEAEEEVSIDEVDEEFEALFAEAQGTISEAIVLELDDEEDE